MLLQHVMMAEKLKFLLQKAFNNSFTIKRILGSAFFALSRYEEIIFSERDMHDRFPAYASIAYMESSVIDKRYMGLGVSAEAADTLLALKNACRMVGGDFSLLWHNTQLVRDDQRSLYKSVLAG